MKRKPIIFMLVLIFLFSLISCATINKGVIVEKRYLPARTLYASGVYNQTKERFQIIFEGENSNDRFRKKKIYVSKQTYDSLQVGDKYSIIK